VIYHRLFICDSGTCEVIACFGVNDSYWWNRELIAQLVHVVDLFVERQPTRTPISDPNLLALTRLSIRDWVKARRAWLTSTSQRPLSMRTIRCFGFLRSQLR
jgi:hypothetical protein